MSLLGETLEGELKLRSLESEASILGQNQGKTDRDMRGGIRTRRDMRGGGEHICPLPIMIGFGSSGGLGSYTVSIQWEGFIGNWEGGIGFGSSGGIGSQTVALKSQWD